MATPNEIRQAREERRTRERVEEIGKKIGATARVVWQWTTGAIILAVIAFVAWAVINSDVLWKAMRYPEAVRQMQIEVVIKK